MPLQDFRRNTITRPLFKWARKALPTLSETEREALEAGDVWWDADLFSGNPDWDKLLATPRPELSAEEQAFIDGPVEELCKQIDDWDINWQRGDLPPEIWKFLKEEKFFAMIIPKQYGGLEFSAYANSEIVRRISTRSVVAAVTVMVPNSLGPGELLMKFGTQEQRDYWLPRLSDGREVPCFGLTSPEAGSDAAAMTDTGVVCRGEYNGEEVLGIRLNWHKRYITLGPVATVLGLAFKLEDPDHLLGDEDELGITVALIPTDLPGVEIGRRHLPAAQMFQNGPNFGKDVFIPFDNVIGGREQVGKGWKMLMSALAAGRGISLPSLSAAAVAYSARTSGAYGRVREQFGIPIGKFEGIQERLGRLAADAYLLDGARRLTCSALDEGHDPAVISAIMKAHATYLMRTAVDDAMDIHAGKAVIDGPNNYLGNLYRAVPVGITVEGANILTRSMIIFGQGAIRCHPWLLKEMLSLEEQDNEKALTAFDQALWGHIGHFFKTLGRAWLRNWSGGLLAPAPDVHTVKPYYRQLSRYAAGFALVADGTLLTFGGGLKRREMISGRLGDVLSELYLLSGALKRWQDEGSQRADLPLLRYALEQGLMRIERSLDLVLDNLPNRVLAWFLRLIVQPLGARRSGASDDLTRQCAELMLKPSATRDRLADGLYLKRGKTGANPIADLEDAFTKVVETEQLRDKLREANIDDLDEAENQGLLSAQERKQLEAAEKARAKVIAVDDFAPSALTRKKVGTTRKSAPRKKAAAKKKKAPAKKKAASQSDSTESESS